MEIVTSCLIIIIYLLLITLLIIAVLIGVKCLQILNKTDKVLDNIKSKLETLDPIFNFIDNTTLSIHSFIVKVGEIKDKLLCKFRL